MQGGGKYKTWTWRQYCDTVKQIAMGLRVIGLRKGETVAVQSETRAEFYLADVAIMTAGGISAALYISLPLADQAKTLVASDARFVFVENAKALKALQAAAPGFECQWILLTGDEPGVLAALNRSAGRARRRIAEFEKRSRRSGCRGSRHSLHDLRRDGRAGRWAW